MTWQFKDPNEVLDYQVDWTAALAGDTISTSNWTVPSGITQDSAANTTTTATIWVSGGTDGTRYDLTNRITTTAGRTFDRVISLFVRETQVAATLTATVGGASSDSYVTEVEYLDYALKRGWTVSTGQEANLRTAALYLDNSYRWKGQRVTSTQALDWPRVMVEYVDGFPVSSETIPQAIKDAQCEMAYLLQGGADPFATLTGGGIGRKREKVDVIERDITYTAPRERPAYPVVDGLVADYANGKAGQVGGSIPLLRA